MQKSLCLKLLSTLFLFLLTGCFASSVSADQVVEPAVSHAGENMTIDSGAPRRFDCKIASENRNESAKAVCAQLRHHYPNSSLEKTLNDGQGLWIFSENPWLVVTLVDTKTSDFGIVSWLQVELIAGDQKRHINLKPFGTRLEDSKRVDVLHSHHAQGLLRVLSQAIKGD